MKKFGLMACVAIYLCSACQKAEILDIEDENNPQAVTDGMKTLFFMPGMDFSMNLEGWKAVDKGETVISRTPLAESADSLLCVDYLENAYFSKKSGPVSGGMSLTLPYGPHVLRFVGHSSTDYSVDTEKCRFSTPKVSETFLKSLDMEVNESTEPSFSVLMQHVVSKLTVVVTDAIPHGVDSVRLTVGNHMGALDMATGYGVAEEEKTFRISWKLGETYVGRKGLSFSAFTFCQEGEFQVPVTIEALDAGGRVLHSQRADAIPLLMNRCTRASCRLFSANTGVTFEDPADWESDKEISF